MDFIVKYVKKGKTVRMTSNELLDTFSKELSSHLVGLDCIQRISINSEVHGRVLVRKES